MAMAPKSYRPKSVDGRKHVWTSRMDGTQEMYNLPQWRRAGGIKDQVRIRDMMTCQQCKKIITQKGEAQVDHIIPHRNDIDLFLSLDNVRLLCRACHSEKTCKEDGGFGHSKKSINVNKGGDLNP